MKTTKLSPHQIQRHAQNEQDVHKGYSVTNIDVKWRHISAGTAVEAKTEGAAIPLSSQNTKSYNFLPYDYLQTVNELCSSLSWTVHTIKCQLCFIGWIMVMFIHLLGLLPSWMGFLNIVKGCVHMKTTHLLFSMSSRGFLTAFEMEFACIIWSIGIYWNIRRHETVLYCT